MPLFAKVAKAVLCVPASSVPSERVFSKTGYLVNKQRSALKSKHVDMLVFRNKNWDIFFSANHVYLLKRMVYLI